MSTLPPRLEALIQRELGATRVELVAPEMAADIPANDGALWVALPRGYTLLVEVPDTGADRMSLQEKLEVLVESFNETLAEALGGVERPRTAEALQAELQALTAAAGAVDAAVIDATSNVTWCAADADDATPHVTAELAQVIEFDPEKRRSSPAPARAPKAPIVRAIEAVRGDSLIATLPKGGSLSHHDRNGPVPYVARSFGTIYVLILVFDAPFDELRAERALHARMGIIERLVLALPPLEPTPIGAKAARNRS